MKRLSVLAIAIWGIACSGDPLGPGHDEFIRARTQWISAGLRDYDFSYTMTNAECAEYFQWEIEVRGGTATKITETRTPCFGNTTPTVTSQSDPTRTMEWLFDRAMGEMRRGSRVTVTYDQVFGFPRTMFVDQNPVTADDEFIVEATLTKTGK